jgi:hypothetical protein
MLDVFPSPHSECMTTVSGVIHLSQRLKPINHITCGEVDPKDFVHFNYITLS